MKYEKGSFIVVPNKEHLEGKPSEMQAIYFWLCSHADAKGTCFPTKSKIAKEAGCSHNTVDKYLKRLVEEGFLSVEQRKKKGTKENTSNIYQLLIMVPPPTKNGTTPPPKIGSETISSINSIHLTTILPTEEAVNSLKEESDVPQSSVVMLPLSRGKTPITRLISVYASLYRYTYSFDIKSGVYGQLGSVFKKLLVDYSEIQISWLLCVFFDWKGMTGENQQEENWLSENSHSIFQFKSGVPKYELYVRNILDQSKEFDDDEALRERVGQHLIGLKK